MTRPFPLETKGRSSLNFWAQGLIKNSSLRYDPSSFHSEWNLQTRGEGQLFAVPASKLSVPCGLPLAEACYIPLPSASEGKTCEARCAAIKLVSVHPIILSGKSVHSSG